MNKRSTDKLKQAQINGKRARLRSNLNLSIQKPSYRLQHDRDKAMKFVLPEVTYTNGEYPFHKSFHRVSKTFGQLPYMKENR